MFKKILGIVGLVLVPLAIGLLVGLSVPVDFIRDRIAATLEESESAGGHDHGGGSQAGSADRVELTQTSQDGMSLKTGSIKLSTYESSFNLPAFVREIPGASDLHVSSRFSGMVKRVFISEGQTVSPGQPVLEIELTGDLLATAQSELLDAQKQISIVEQEIARLEPSVRSGGVASKLLIETRYQRDRLIAKVETKSQELLVRGLSQEQIDEIILSKKLLRSVIVSVPEDLIPPQLNAGTIMKEAPETFLVESLLAKPGSMAQTGDDLCELSFHAIVVVEGQAYEKDLPSIRKAIGNQTMLNLTIGPVGSQELISGQSIAYLSNHVDSATNTYPFYIYLHNEILDLETPGYQSTGYALWKWKPGQRAHIEIPDVKFENSIVIPRGALAIDGLSNFVFRWNGVVEHDHGEEDGADHSGHDHEIMDEFQAIEVIVIHMDRRRAVIARSDKLSLGDRIAFNNANQLLFAMQVGSGDSHAGHSH